jgi:REP element-mobilizing transposase RayT
MPQSLSAVYIHLVFSTKDRFPFLGDTEIRQATFAYLSGTSKNLDCPTLAVSGMSDHVHILARFGRTLSQADWVKELKRVSHGWLKQQGTPLAKFKWQAGYADFSVSQSNLHRVKQYINEQERHHRQFGFQDELRALLRKHQIDFDERYMWD